MQPEHLDPLIMQNDERHETLKNLERTSEHQLMKQDEMTEGIKDLNRTAEHLLMQGDEQKNQSFEIEANDQNSLALWNLLRGPKGNKGDKGDKGDTGENAIHNPEIAIEALRNDEAFQTAVKGEKGDQGEQGPAGMDGRDGMDGVDGRDGMDGAMGIQGIQGEQGPKGDRGLRGFKGEPGRDGKGVDEKTVKDLKEGVDFAVKRASKTVSLVELDDVDLSQATMSNGKYVIGGGGSGSGDVVGPASAVNNNFASFNTTTGKLIKDSGSNASSFAAALTSDQNYVSDAQLTVIGNTSGTNTGDQDLSGLVPYTGATADLNLGTHEIVTSSVHANSSAGVTIHNTSGQDVAMFGSGGGINGTMYGNLSMNTVNKIVNMADPTSAQDGATKAYADGLVANLLDYRGAYNASVNTFPASGGSGTAGAVVKGDMWIVSVAGTLGGSAVQIGDSLIAAVDTPGQTAGNWNILNANISYVPEDVANKATTMSGNTASDTKYLSAKAVYDWGVATFAALAGSISQAFAVSQLEVGHASDTTITRTGAGAIAVEGVAIPTISSTSTMTNKRVTPRITTATSYTTSTTIDSDANDQYIITAQAGALLFNNPTGTPTDGQKLIIAVTGTAARALTWGTAFEASTVALPTTTVTTARLNLGFIYRSDTSKWVLVAQA